MLATHEPFDRLQVVDGDTVRVRHTPLLSLERWLPVSLFDAPTTAASTITVRLAAVDAPETAKFGGEGQPLADIAKALAEEELLGRKVFVKLLARDQYHRAIATVEFLFSLTYIVLPDP